MANIRAPETRHAVEIAITIRIFDPDAFTAHHHATAFSRERFEISEGVKVMPRIGGA